MEWIEYEIKIAGNNQTVLEELLLQLYDSVISRLKLESWHFFREPSLRLRILADEYEIPSITRLLTMELDKEEEVVDFYESCHGVPDKKYHGERDAYGSAWNRHYVLWNSGAELAVKIIRDGLDRDYHYRRARHLIHNQILPNVSEIEP